MSDRPSTLRDLEASGYRSRTVRQEMRENLVARLRSGDDLFPGIIGFEDSVEPGIVNALLAGHDLILLGLRGQAKTRLLRALTSFLDPEIPYIVGTPLRDDPLAPVSPEGRRLVMEHGDDLPIAWLARDERYQEKLATPDVSMADLIGDIDPIKAAARGHSLLDEEAIAYGIIPRANRGLFAINELPDLSPRIQVALLNVMEERDVQIRGFPVRFPLDLMLVFSANPEDYTKRGNLITPLRDRIAAQVHTHYPRSLEDGMRITSQEAWTDRDGPRVIVPRIAHELIEEVANVARASEWVDQSSGVSARLTISLLEAVVSNAERRAYCTGADTAVVRLSDFFRATSAITGKIELVFEGEREGPEKVATALVGKAAACVFDRRFPDFFSQPDDEGSTYASLADHFKRGGEAVCDDGLEDGEASAELGMPGLTELVERYLGDLEPEATVFGKELVLEGLHQHSVLAREQAEHGPRYSDMVSRMFEDNFDPTGLNG
ncbi:MAG: magnesium chelatase [Planctomycetes bacterium]|nr:magnesium chelatase [Planctomycetota bacterium]